MNARIPKLTQTKSNPDKVPSLSYVWRKESQEESPWGRQG